MKRLLAALTTAILFASCNSGSNDAETKKESPKEDFMVTREGTPPQQDSPPVLGIEPYLLDTVTADQLIKAYYEGTGHGLKTKVWMADADMLRNYLNADTSLHMLDIYIGQPAPDSFAMIMVGATTGYKMLKNVHGEDSVVITVYHERLYWQGGQGFVLDNIRPCPKCERVPYTSGQ